MASVDPNDRPNCFACESFYITYDKQRPYGCRAFGMKSQPLPSIAVFQNSGAHCQLYHPKPKPPKSGPR